VKTSIKSKFLDDIFTNNNSIAIDNEIKKALAITIE
jgi:hypothetical protein